MTQTGVCPVITGTGKGYTVIVKLMAGPAQGVTPPVNVGVTVIVATMGEVVVLMAVKDGIFPLPKAARPMLVVLLLHEYIVAPGGVLLLTKVTVTVDEPWHTT